MNTDKKELKDIQKIELLFENKSTDVFSELEGPFVLIIITGEEDFFILRDYLGIKPLYYSLNKRQNKISFASEIKAIDPFIGKDELFILKPGKYIKNGSKPEYFKEFKPVYIKDSELTDEEEAAKKIDNLLVSAIKKRLAPYKNKAAGVWLSGGLDSSLIAAILKKCQENIMTFSVGFEDSPDLLASRIVANHIGSKHTEHILEIDEIFNLIPEVVYALESFDAPLIRSSVGNMIVSRLSSEADIVFSGEGGDEVFAGYNYFLDFDSDNTIREELLKALKSLHNTALQRVDRFTNLYSVDVKLPLLDEKLIDLSLKIHPRLKINNNITKYILRKVALKYLPADIVWRPKDKFWEGSGINEKLKTRIDKTISDDEFDKYLKLSGNLKLRSKEEMFYFKIFKELFPNTDYRNILSFTEDFI